MEGITSLASLERWSSAGWSEGIQIDELVELESLTVSTWHTVYEIIVLTGDTGKVLVRGGRYFPAYTAAQLVGSSVGGSFLKRLGIYRGFRLEFLLEDRRIVTSPVTSARITPSIVCG
jgi:hypothetical protein